MESVLRCQDCNKPFDKGSTLKRHGYYCRLRPIKPARKDRSCVECARRKLRCNNGKPGCIRCAERRVCCVYPSSLPKPEKPRITQKNAPVLARQAIEDQTFPSVFPTLSDCSRTVDNFDITSPRNDYGNEDIGLDNNSMTTDVHLLDLTERSSWSNHPSYQPFTSYVLHEGQLSQPMEAWDLAFYPAFYPASTLPISPCSNIRLLTSRPEQDARSIVLTNLIVQNLRSYSLMIGAHSTLPPFIHHAMMSSSSLSSQVEPLTNCISLMQMISSSVGSSRKLFWRTVKTECERLCAEYKTLNIWELLTAMQALSIYLLVRLEEGETEHNNLDILLTSTITCIARQTASHDLAKGNDYTRDDQSIEARWVEWIMTESMRRLCIIYQMVNMLVYFEPAAMCELHSSDLVLAPLPDQKQLWEARDAHSWISRLQNIGHKQTLYGLGKGGHLVRLDEDEKYQEGPRLPQNFLDLRALPRRRAEWKEWCAGIDGLGSLIMLAASLAI